MDYLNALEGQAMMEDKDIGIELASMVTELFDKLRNEATPDAVREWFTENQPHRAHGTPMTTIARMLKP